MGPTVGPAPRPRVGPVGPAAPGPPTTQAELEASSIAPEAAAADGAPKVRVGHMDHFAAQKRVSWDELKTKLAEASFREEGVPGSNSFDSYSAKLEKSRNEKLQHQEVETKKMLKQINRGKLPKKDKKDKKEKKQKGPKRTADGAVLAKSSGSSSADEDALLSRYKKA